MNHEGVRRQERINDSKSKRGREKRKREILKQMRRRKEDGKKEKQRV